jgi:hypothetical protein
VGVKTATTIVKRDECLAKRFFVGDGNICSAEPEEE